jgi:hypothetical protein
MGIWDLEATVLKKNIWKAGRQEKLKNEWFAAGRLRAEDRPSGSDFVMAVRLGLPD